MHHFPLKGQGTEVDENSAGTVRRSKIRSELSAINWSECLSGLELDNHGSLHDEIEAMLAHNERPIPDPDLPFPLDGKTTAAQFGKKSACINSLEKTRAERLVDTPGGLHDLPYKSIDFPLYPIERSSACGAADPGRAIPAGIAASG